MHDVAGAEGRLLPFTIPFEGDHEPAAVVDPHGRPGPGHAVVALHPDPAPDRRALGAVGGGHLVPVPEAAIELLEDGDEHVVASDPPPGGLLRGDRFVRRGREVEPEADHDGRDALAGRG